MSWQIQLNFNDGYPLNTDNTAFAPPLSAPYPTRVMRTDAEVNEGYPFNANNIVFAPSISAPYPYKVMRIDGVTNDGYPFLWWQDTSNHGEDVNRLYLHAARPTALFFGQRRVVACYYNRQLVYRRLEV